MTASSFCVAAPEPAQVWVEAELPGVPSLPLHARPNGDWPPWQSLPHFSLSWYARMPP